MTSIRSNSQKTGYSLVELLVVITIIALLTAAGGPAFSALTSSGSANQNLSQLSGILEQAREYAVAQNTYVWVAFYTPTATATGFKQVSVAVIASTDGTDPAVVNSSAWESYPYGALPGAGGNLSLVNKVVTLKQVYLQPSATFTPANYPTLLPSYPTVTSANSLASGATFSVPVQGGSVTFDHAIQFTPSGQARNASSPINVIDLDIQPQKGTVDDIKNVAVLRVNGLTGETVVFRP